MVEPAVGDGWGTGGGGGSVPGVPAVVGEPVEVGLPKTAAVGGTVADPRTASVRAAIGEETDAANGAVAVAAGGSGVVADSMLPHALSRKDARRSKALKRTDIVEPLSLRPSLDEKAGELLQPPAPRMKVNPHREMVLFSVTNPSSMLAVQRGIERQPERGSTDSRLSELGDDSPWRPLGLHQARVRG